MPVYEENVLCTTVQCYVFTKYLSYGMLGYMGFTIKKQLETI